MGRPAAFFGSQKKKMCHLNDRRLLKPTLDDKKKEPFPQEASKWADGATAYDIKKGKNDFLRHGRPFSKHFIGLIENKVSCINKHTIYTSIT